MLSKHHHRNTWYGKLVVNSRGLINGKQVIDEIHCNRENPECPTDKEFFIPINLPNYDYLIYQSNNIGYGHPRILLGSEEKTKISRYSKPVYYVQEHHVVTIDTGERVVLKQLMSIKTDEILFEDSIFYQDYKKFQRKTKETDEKENLKKELKHH